MSSICPNELKDYWANSYPCEAVVEMLTRNGDPLKHFEFAFECESLAGGGTWMKRYMSFGTAADLRAELEHRSTTSKVLKLHIGCAWNGVPRKVVNIDNPCDHDLDRLRPERAPLRIDIDLTDYTPLGIKSDDMKGNDLHWPILEIAIRITKRCLKDCFMLDEVVSFYSGRRGVHLWVLDERSWQMNDEARAVVIEFLSCPLDKHGVARDTFLERTPWYEEIYSDIIFPGFVNMLKTSDMDLFSTTESVLRFQQMVLINHPEISHVFRELRMDTRTGPAQKFERLTNTIDNLVSEHPASCGWMRKRLDAAVLTLLWPRFDKGASTKLNHLIKAPFSVHSSTKRISVPLRDDMTNFCPEDVPMVGHETHMVESAEGDLRDKLSVLGAPKPWVDPVEAWYMNWSPLGIDPVMQQVQSFEEEERRAKRRKLGIDDESCRFGHVVNSNMWGIRISRVFEICASETHLHMRTRFCKLKGSKKDPIMIAVGTNFIWKYSITAKSVWDAIELNLHAIKETWIPVSKDVLIVLFAADAFFSTTTKISANERMDAILERSANVGTHDHVSVRLHDSKYLTWRAVFPEVVRLWPVPGVVNTEQ
jgi:DNA primase small subunit